MKSLTLKSLALSLSLLFLSSASFAATPLLVYSYGNQVASSTLAVSSDGNIIHTERLQGQIQVLNENPLSGAELAILKSHIAKASRAVITKTQIPASLGSQSGTIATFVGSQKKDLEGIVRTPVDLTKATKLSNKSSSMKNIKSFINKYVKVKIN